jgi:hypothetical protein
MQPCDKTILYFMGALTVIAAIISIYFLSVLLTINSQHQELEAASMQDIEAINNLSELIISNQHLILANQDIDKNISEAIDTHLKTMSYSPENNKLLKEILNILNNKT